MRADVSRSSGRRPWYLLGSCAIAVVVASIAVLPYVTPETAPGHAPSQHEAAEEELAAVTEEGDDTSVTIDESTLGAALSAAGIELPQGSAVYAARVQATAGGLTYEAYEAGAGSDYEAFWPASSIKLLAAVGALEYLGELGFTGAARITMEGETFSVTEVYEAAIADSSNEAYDRLVQIAGLDWLNEEFLTAENGWGATVIQRAYTGLGVTISPAMTITEGSRHHSVPARRATGSYECADDGNCSNLLELTESVRRVVLDAEIPEDEQFAIADADVAGLTAALLASEGFVEPAVSEVLGDDALAYNKPGYVPGDECLDVALVSDDDGSDRYLLAVVTPEDGWLCPTVVDVAAATLEFLVASDA